MWKVSLIFVIAAASATFYFTSQNYQNTPHAVNERTWFDESGHLHVMGTVLEESTLRDAEKVFLSRADAAVFLYPEPDEEGVTEKKFHGELEAYFPSIADHSKVILKMFIQAKDLEAMRQRSRAPRVYPNGVIRMNLSNQDIEAIQHMVIRELTLIPSVQLDEVVLNAQFGAAEKVVRLDEGSKQYFFPKLGLVATINDSGKDQLHFSNEILTPQ